MKSVSNQDRMPNQIEMFEEYYMKNEKNTEKVEDP